MHSSNSIKTPSRNFVTTSKSNLSPLAPPWNPSRLHHLRHPVLSTPCQTSNPFLQILAPPQRQSTPRTSSPPLWQPAPPLPSPLRITATTHLSTPPPTPTHPPPPPLPQPTTTTSPTVTPDFRSHPYFPYFYKSPISTRQTLFNPPPTPRPRTIPLPSMPFNFNTAIPTYQLPPSETPEQRLAATTPFFYPSPLKFDFLDEEEEEPPSGPADSDFGSNVWSLPADEPGWNANDWPTTYLLRHNTVTGPLQYPSPPPSPHPTHPQYGPLGPVDLVQHYLFDPKLTPHVNVERLRRCSPFPDLVKLVLRHTFFNPEHAPPLLLGLKIVLDLPYTPYITRRIRHKGSLHAHFAPYPGDPFCTCECCLYCPLHHAAHPNPARNPHEGE